jgi:flagellar basal body P-ring formation protein FlgA
MMFAQTISRTAICLALALGVCAGPASSLASEVALVPERTIYPGETITGEMVRSVGVTNPNLAGGYASDVAEVSGMIATRTLLPGRTIPVASLREAWAVERGTPITLVFSDQGLVITAPGTPLQNASVGEMIRVRNVDSGVVVSGTVMQDGSVRVLRK